MDKMEQQVREFALKFGVESAFRPSIMRATLRKKLIREEIDELFEAIDANDLVKTIDGICDSIYTLIGAAVCFGVSDLGVYYDEVHRSNMEKVDGGSREDGKILKPQGWVGPDIAGLLRDERVLREQEIEES